jgi:WD40 repeat protein
MVNRFEGGSQIGVSYLSPSGLRLLTGAIWRDLATGQVVDFGARHEFDPYDTPLPNPAWSSDETRLFSCCFQYADVGTGEYVEFSLTPVDLPGRDGPGPGSPGLSSWWVLGDTRALTGIDLYDYSTVTLYPIIPVIDPLTRAYSDLGAITSLRTNPICPFIDISVAPDRAHVVIRCEQMQVIDLRTLTAQPIITGHDFVSWSPDGQYALFTKGQGMRWHEPVRNGEFALWPLIEGDAYLITDRVIRTPVWNPHGKWLAYFSDDGKTLITLEAATRASRVVLLPQPFVSAVWSLQGDMLAVIAEDGSVWAASPALGQAQQLTPPLPNVRDVRWSPSGNQLAFVSGADVYVVSVTVGMAQPNYPALWQVVGMFMLVYAPAYWWAGARPRR